MRGKSNKRIRKRAKTACKGWKKVTGALQENILTLLCFDAEACPLIIAAVDTTLFESQIYRNIADRAIAYFRKYKTAAGDHLPDLLEDFLKSTKRAEVRLYTDALNDLFRTHDGINREYILGELQVFVKQQSLRQSITLAAQELQAGNADTAKSVLAKCLDRIGRPHSDGLLGLEGAIQPYAQFDSTEFPPVQSALSPVLDFPGMLQINGFRGHFKSLLATYMAVGLAAGKGVFGWPCDRPYKVALVDGEMPPATIQKRIRGAIDDLGVRRRRVRRNLHVLAENQKLLKGPINLADPKQHDELLEHFCRYEVVFLDSIVMLTSGVDLDTGKGWDAINTLCTDCIANGTSIVRLQHLGKDKSKGGIGSSYQEFPADFILKLEQKSSDTFHGNTIIKVTSTKHRNCAPGDFQPLELELSKGTEGQLKVSHSTVYRNKTEAIAEDILCLISSGDWEEINKTEFAEKHGVTRKTVYAAADKAREKLKRQEEEESLIK